MVEQHLKKAVEADPDFAPGYAMLANGYLHRLGGRMSLAESSSAAHTAIDKVQELDPDSTQYFRQLGQIYNRLDLDYAKAQASVNEGLDRSPAGTVWFHDQLAKISLREGRVTEAVQQMATASVLDYGPEQATFFILYGRLLLVTGDYEGALSHFVNGLKLTPLNRANAPVLRDKARALISLGRIDEAKISIAAAWALDGSVTQQSYIDLFVATGDRARAEHILADAKEHDKSVSGRAYLSLGDIDNTFAVIRRKIEDHDELLIDSLRVAAWWDPIRDDPRFDEMLELLDSKETHTNTYLNTLDPVGI